MIRIYCRLKHNQHGKGLCPHCSEVLKYAHQRLENCVFGDGKPACAKCPVHCYKPEMRAKIRTIMRFSGPLMPLAHPVDTLRHYISAALHK